MEHPEAIPNCLCTIIEICYTYYLKNAFKKATFACL